MPALNTETGLKRCTQCALEKPAQAYSKHKQCSDGLRPNCKACHNVYKRGHIEVIKASKEPRIVRIEKTCFACGTVKPITEFFKSNSSSDKFAGKCKKCQRTYQREWESKNIVEHRKKKRAYFEANREHLKEKMHVWRKKNGKGTEYWRKRHALKRGAEICDFTAIQWEQLKEAYNHSCAFCSSSEDITADHNVPLIRRGDHTLENIIPLCRVCNGKKGDSTLLEFIFEATL